MLDMRVHMHAHLCTGILSDSSFAAILSNAHRIAIEIHAKAILAVVHKVGPFLG